ncbi:uncharacterized protein F54F2.9 [Bombyx mandarina]|uniref:Uncharacterized protein F54F2.9 n=2 Tax=Bombyx TaxID=7090 RepID=A0A6J2KDC9_BOMMA|nr:uncharacterized protein F54F2.9 [Bombyx mandarina]
MRWIFLLLLTFVLSVAAWDDDDLEVFDVVEEVNQNFYELMGVSQDATPAQIKSAFKKLTLKLHPDKNDSPDADVQFRNLVSVHNVLKDPGKREKYNEVLKNGLPNWRSAVYYYRHLRKMGLAEASIILFIIISLGQYAVSWAAYVEKRYTAEQILNSRGRKSKKTGFDVGLSEILDQLPKPSVKDTLPFQIPRLAWWTVTAIPRSYVEIKKQLKEKEEEAKRQKKREEEEKQRLEREAAAAAERESAGAAGTRRRRGFVPPELEHDARPRPPHDPAATLEDKPSSPMISGGLWTDDDLAELARLMSRVPGGAPQRWERIAAALRRAVPEVAHMAAKLKERPHRPPGHEPPQPEYVEPPKKVKTRKEETGSGGAWSQSQQKALETALAKYPKGGAGDRWQKISNSVPGKTKEECMQRCKYLSDMLRKQKQKEEEEKHKEEDVDEGQSQENGDVTQNGFEETNDDNSS